MKSCFPLFPDGRRRIFTNQRTRKESDESNVRDNGNDRRVWTDTQRREKNRIISQAEEERERKERSRKGKRGRRERRGTEKQ